MHVPLLSFPNSSNGLHHTSDLHLNVTSLVRLSLVALSSTSPSYIQHNTLLVGAQHIFAE